MAENNQKDNDSSSSYDEEIRRIEEHEAEQEAALAVAATSSAAVYTNTCCGRCRAELNPCQDHFLVRDAATGRDLDIPESFAPPLTAFTLAYKLVGVGVSLVTLVWGWLDAAKHFYLAFLTHWTVVFCAIYFLLSLWNTIMAERTPQVVSLRIKWTWVMAQVAATLEAVVVFNYWYQLHDWDEPTDNLTFLNLSAHGGLAIWVWINVLYVDQIPFRWMHWWCYVFPIASLWILWSVLHAFVGDIGNPTRDGSSGDPDTNDDLIYDFLDWRNDWEEALIMIVINLFAVGPFFFSILWLSSIYKWPFCCVKDRRHYLDSFRDDKEQNGPTVEDVEEGSIFQKWTNP